MEVNEIDFDQIVLEKYKNGFFENLIFEFLNKYKQVFLLVYDKYNLRFKKIYDVDLSIFFYYLKFLELVSKEADITIIATNKLSMTEVEKSINKNLTVWKDVHKHIDKTQKIISEQILKSIIFFVEDKIDFENMIKKHKEKVKEKRLYIGLSKKDIFDLIDKIIFIEVDYFISIAEDKKYVNDHVVNHRQLSKRAYFIYNEYDKNISKTKSISLALDDPYYKSDSTNPMHKAVEKFFKLSEYKENIKTNIDNQIREQLKALK